MAVCALKTMREPLGVKLKPTSKMQARRGYYACLLANDIGSYNSCMHLCKYCYANGNSKMVLSNYQNHDDNSPFLIGTLKENDNIKVASQSSWIVKEEGLFSEFAP